MGLSIPDGWEAAFTNYNVHSMGMLTTWACIQIERVNSIDLLLVWDMTTVRACLRYGYGNSMDCVLHVLDIASLVSECYITCKPA